MRVRFPPPPPEPREGARTRRVTARGCSTGCLTVFLALAGVFCLAVAAFPRDACDTAEGVGGYFFVSGLLLVGTSTYLVARARTERAWVAWSLAVVTALALGFGVSLFSLLRWVETCSN
jgi:hypothetical protein